MTQPTQDKKLFEQMRDKYAPDPIHAAQKKASFARHVNNSLP
jgi:hypothetical protein